MAETGTNAHRRKPREDYDNSSSRTVSPSSGTGRTRVPGSMAATSHDGVQHGRRGSITNPRVSTDSSPSGVHFDSSSAFSQNSNAESTPLLMSSDHTSLDIALRQIHTGFTFVGQVIHPLFAKAIMPATKFEMFRVVRAVLIDIIKDLKDMEEAEEARRQGGGQEREGAQPSEASTSRTGNRDQVMNDLYKLPALRAVHKWLVASHRNSYGAGSHYTGWDEVNGKKDLERFSGEIIDCVSTLPSLDNMISVLGIVNRACSALRDWRDRYDWEEIRSVKEELDAFESHWIKNKPRPSGRDRDRDETVEEEIEKARKELRTMNDRAERLKSQVKEQKEKKRKKSDAKNRLEKAIKEMHALWEARQNRNAAAMKKSGKWLKQSNDRCSPQ